MAPPKSALFLLLSAFLVATGCSSRPAYQPASASSSDTSGPSNASAGSSPTSGEGGDSRSGIPKEREIGKEDPRRPGGYLRDITFDYDRAEINDSARAELSQNAGWLLENPTARILVEGHCDDRGTSQYNLALGEKRASTVKEYLGSAGVDGSRIEIVSYGKERPLDTRQNEEAWAKNRRAHFVVTQK